MNNKDELSENWTMIEQKVLKPLYNKEFKAMYNMAKLDYDDFVSLAGVEIVKAIDGFDSNRCKLTSYVQVIVRNKAKTELTRYVRRKKRQAFLKAYSLNKQIDEDGRCLGDLISVEEVDSNINLNTQNAVKDILKSLQNTFEREVLKFILNGFSIREIANNLNMCDVHIRGILKDISTRSEVIRIAKMYGILGGNEDEE